MEIRLSSIYWQMFGLRVFVSKSGETEVSSVTNEMAENSLTYISSNCEHADDIRKDELCNQCNFILVQEYSLYMS